MPRTHARSSDGIAQQHNRCCWLGVRKRSMPQNIFVHMVGSTLHELDCNLLACPPTSRASHCTGAYLQPCFDLDAAWQGITHSLRTSSCGLAQLPAASACLSCANYIIAPLSSMMTHHGHFTPAPAAENIKAQLHTTSPNHATHSVQRV